MSVELRFDTEHGHIESDLGRIEHPEPRPDLNQVGHLVLTSAEYVTQLLADGPQERRTGRIDSATVDDNNRRLFAHCEHNGQRWTWELFDAHWDDGISNGHAWLIGRWPD